MKVVEIDPIGAGLLSLPNSVAVLNERQIVVADGGSNSIKVFCSLTGGLVHQVGTFGLGEYKYKEPVGAFVSRAGQVFVMDWHNHRIVVLDSRLEYQREFGHFGKAAGVGSLARSNLVALVRSFGASGSYIGSHFSHDQRTRPNVSRARTSRNMLEGCTYFLRKGFIRRVVGDMQIDKPNGAGFTDDFVFITSKNLRTVTKVHLGNGQIAAQCSSPGNGKQFGRLGNVCVSERGDRVYVCDQHNQTVWILDDRLNYLESIDSGVLGTTFWPFAICFIEDHVIALTDNTTFLIIDEKRKQVLYRSQPIGEPHGIDFCRKSERVFVADRLNGCVRRFQLRFEREQ